MVFAITGINLPCVVGLRSFEGAGSKEIGNSNSLYELGYAGTMEQRKFRPEAFLARAPEANQSEGRHAQCEIKAIQGGRTWNLNLNPEL